jgi:hypothetical protein
MKREATMEEEIERSIKKRNTGNNWNKAGKNNRAIRAAHHY